MRMGTKKDLEKSKLICFSGMLFLFCCFILFLYDFISDITTGRFDYFSITGAITIFQLIILQFFHAYDDNELSYRTVYVLNLTIIIASGINLIFMGTVIIIQHFYNDISGVGLKDGLLFGIMNLIFFIVKGFKFYCYFIDTEDTPEKKHQLTDKDKTAKSAGNK